MPITSHAPFPIFISAQELEKIDLRPAVLHTVAKQMWRDLETKKTFGKKSVLYPREADLWKRPEFSSLRSAFRSERLGWKLSALTAVGRDYAAVKIVGANAVNRHFGAARSTSMVLLFDKFSMRPLCLMEGTTLSAARTGTYGGVVAEAMFAKDQRIKVFLFGGGPVARSITLSLRAISDNFIEALWVRTRSMATAEAFASSLAHTGLPLVPVADNTMLADADLVVTASNANGPVFAADEPRTDAVVLHLGGDETPATFLTKTLRRGTLVCDDITMVSQRNSQSLALLFSGRGALLETEGPLLGIANLADLVAGKIQCDYPVHITCVGLPSLDLYVAAHIYQEFVAQRPALELSEHAS